ncbi:MAG: winged helix DNA-binding protein [Oscillospiraceae bacterium]|nr:winged helix DNA-binding protein [Oscillospiraceae bacterium]
MNDINFRTQRKIIKIGNHLNNARDAYLCRKDLTSVQSDTLLFYHRNQGKSITDLKNHLQVTHQAARKLVEKLKMKGYLNVVSSQKDARMAEVSLTDKGLEICTRLINDGTRTAIDLLNGFSMTEKETLLSFLMRVEENINY